jgi:hypothetical protein
VVILNVGRDSFHIEPNADYEWLENLTVHTLMIDNCGRDALNFTLPAGLTAVFGNEMNFENLEARYWKRNAIRARSASDQGGYFAAVKFGKANFDAQRPVANLDDTNIARFETVPGAYAPTPGKASMY